MSKKYFKDPSGVQTLFHMLGGEEKPTLSDNEVNKHCETILSSFKELLTYDQPKSIIELGCVKKYKITFNELLNDYNIDLDEMPSYKANEAMWIDLIEIVYFSVADNKQDFIEEVKTLVRKISESCMVLNVALNLKMKKADL